MNVITSRREVVKLRKFCRNYKIPKTSFCDNFLHLSFSSLRIDNSHGSVNSSALSDKAGMRWYQRKYHVLYNIIQPIINSIY